MLVIAAVILHGLNGIRIILTSFGLGVKRQKLFFYIVVAVALIVILFFAALLTRG